MKNSTKNDILLISVFFLVLMATLITPKTSEQGEPYPAEDTSYLCSFLEEKCYEVVGEGHRKMGTSYWIIDKGEKHIRVDIYNAGWVHVYQQDLFDFIDEYYI